ncbi:hypothetical protein [Polyangium mundeleinium]|uniref:Type II secretion system protein GspE N-terminal domain-containing protein n=1 Tax=Polyangium mundeleinium TaxID=2995306 RepID=A0ABT5EYV5_9BACT|nr:hypothetical protein [Polyangium mundeleinium]MDC0747020.1 hypothetical protein [Polyangium mundeleinium]
MPTPRLRLGQLLVDAGLLSQQDLDEVLALQKTDGRRLGTLLVERGYINETQLTQILSHQLSVPWVSLLHIEFSRQLLNLVPHHVAERFCVVPIYVRHVRGQGQTLYVAMDDPSNEDGLRACGEHSGLPVKAMIAPPSDIRNAIRVYYDVQVGASAQPPAHLPSNEPPPLAERDTTPDGTRPEVAPEVSLAIAETPAAPFVAPVEGPAVEVAEITVSSLELPGSDPEHSPPKPQPSAARSAPKTPPPPTTQDAVALAEALAPAPARGKMPSAPDMPPPPTLPDPGAQSPQLEEVAAKTRVSIVEARPLPPPSERLRRVLEITDDPQPPTLDEGALPPSSQPVDTIPEPRGRAPRMIALTLLDGTTISLPAPRKQKQRVPTLAQPTGGPSEEELPPSTLGAEDDRAGLTARDLVAALRAVCHGADAKEILGPNLRWEAIAAALLSVLLRKGLVADWEFVDELKKI